VMFSLAPALWFTRPIFLSGYSPLFCYFVHWQRFSIYGRSAGCLVFSFIVIILSDLFNK
jgi:hypothetical protein